MFQLQRLRVTSRGPAIKSFKFAGNDTRVVIIGGGEDVEIVCLNMYVKAGGNLGTALSKMEALLLDNRREIIIAENFNAKHEA